MTGHGAHKFDETFYVVCHNVLQTENFEHSDRCKWMPSTVDGLFSKTT